MDINGSYDLTTTFSDYLASYGFNVEDDSEYFSFDGYQNHEGRRVEVIRARGAVVRGARKLVYELVFREDRSSFPVSSVEVLIVRDDSSEPVHSKRNFSGNSETYRPILERILEEDIRPKLSDLFCD